MNRRRPRASALRTFGANKVINGFHAPLANFGDYSWAHGAYDYRWRRTRDACLCVFAVTFHVQLLGNSNATHMYVLDGSLARLFINHF